MVVGDSLFVNLLQNPICNLFWKEEKDNMANKKRKMIGNRETLAGDLCFADLYKPASWA